MAVDLSKALNTCGYISYLRRLEVGCFNQLNILILEEVENICKNGKIEKMIKIE